MIVKQRHWSVYFEYRVNLRRVVEHCNERYREGPEVSEVSFDLNAVATHEHNLSIEECDKNHRLRID